MLTVSISDSTFFTRGCWRSWIRKDGKEERDWEPEPFLSSRVILQSSAMVTKTIYVFLTWKNVRKRNQDSNWLQDWTVYVQSLSRVWLFAIPWTAARQASLSFTISRSFLKLMFIELTMPSNHLILCCPLLHLPSISYTRCIFVAHLETIIMS